MPDFTSLRSMVNRFLTDRCTINDPAPEPVFSSTTGTYEDNELGDQVYAGPCRVTPYRRDGVIQTGEEFLTESRLTVYLPATAVGVRVGQLVTVTGSSDGDLVDRLLRVSGVEGETEAVYRKLECQDTLSDAEVGS